jgi:hypothetical protein
MRIARGAIAHAAAGDAVGPLRRVQGIANSSITGAAPLLGWRPALRATRREFRLRLALPAAL